jgi:hypothetical protein
MARSRGAIVDDLHKAARTHYPVEIDRGQEGWENWVNGFVASVGERWVVLQSLAETVYPDGYHLLRLADITNVVEDREGGYIERAVAALGGRPKVDFHLPADAVTKDVLREAAAHSKVISVFLEAEPDSPRLVGRLDRLGDKKFHMQLINPRGAWTPGTSGWWYRDVTSVSFGSRYETALERFGEECPAP